MDIFKINILDRYIAKHIIRYIALSLFLLVGISLIIKFMDRMRNINENYTLLIAIFHVLVSSIKDITLFFNVACLLGVLIGLGSLATSNELSVMQTSGFSKFKIGWAVIKTIIPLTILIFCISEFLVPKSETLANQLKEGKALANISLSEYGLWTKEDNNFIYIQQFINGNETKLNNLKIYTFDDNRKLTKITEASSATYEQEKWYLHDSINTEITEQQLITTKNPKMLWDTQLTPSKLSIASYKPENLPIKDLIKYKNFLKDSKQSYQIIDLGLWKKILQPLSTITMTLLGMSFVFGMLRTTPAGVRVLVGIIIGMTFYIINELAGRFGLIYNIPAFLVSILPSLIFLTIAIYLLKYKRN